RRPGAPVAEVRPLAAVRSMAPPSLQDGQAPPPAAARAHPPRPPAPRSPRPPPRRRARRSPPSPLDRAEDPVDLREVGLQIGLLAPQPRDLEEEEGLVPAPPRRPQHPHLVELLRQVVGQEGDLLEARLLRLPHRAELADQLRHPAVGAHHVLLDPPLAPRSG